MAKLVEVVLLTYQVYVPLHPVAVRLTVPVPQRTTSEPVGADGIAVTKTLAVAVALQSDALITVTVYIPDIVVIPLGIVGFCKLEVKPFGPAHE